MPVRGASSRRYCAAKLLPRAVGYADTHEVVGTRSMRFAAGREGVCRWGRGRGARLPGAQICVSLGQRTRPGVPGEGMGQPPRDDVARLTGAWPGPCRAQPSHQGEPRPRLQLRLPVTALCQLTAGAAQVKRRWRLVVAAQVAATGAAGQLLGSKATAGLQAQGMQGGRAKRSPPLVHSRRRHQVASAHPDILMMGSAGACGGGAAAVMHGGGGGGACLCSISRCLQRVVDVNREARRMATCWRACRVFNWWFGAW
jgi:hypothetical protein